jgi:FkbM family methyltransferase
MDHNDLKNFDFLKSFIEKGDVLVDVGANYGDYTNFFLENLENTGKIYSFELDPETTNVLKNRFENNLNIEIYNKAVSNENSIINYYKGRDAWTNNIIGHDMNFQENPVGGQVEAIRLDTFLSNEDSIKLVKIDVEGAEKYVLEGLENIISKIKYILVECHLEQDWDIIKEMIIVKYNLTCIDLENMKKVNYNSSKPYQCFCVNKKNI